MASSIEARVGRAVRLLIGLSVFLAVDVLLVYGLLVAVSHG